MITLDIQGQEFKLATSYEELSIGQYIRIVKLNDDKNTLTGNQISVKVISILSDRPEELEPLIWQLSQDDFISLAEAFDWVADHSLIEAVKTKEKKPSLMIDSKPYGVITNFNKQITLGDQVSLETILGSNTSLHNLEVAFGIILRPLDANGNMVKFSQEVFDSNLEILDQVKMIDIYSTLAFFFTGETHSTANTTKGFSLRAS